MMTIVAGLPLAQREPIMEELQMDARARELRNIERQTGTWKAAWKEGEAEGRRLALREALETLLQAQGIELGPAESARIHDCEDPELLQRWVARAAYARTGAEFFEDR